MKEQDKPSGEKKLDETKTTNLPDKNFKSNGHKYACQTYKTRRIQWELQQREREKKKIKY